MKDMTELLEEIAEAEANTKKTTPAEEATETVSEDEAAEPTTPDVTSELEALRAEVASLKDALAQKIAEAQMIRGQLSEFSELFPSVTPEDIPVEVWQSITSGGSLAAAYALYHRKEQLHRDRVRELNSKNAELSTGKVGVDTAKEYFTPSEVRAMSRGEVRENYSKILNSMKKWN